jgi:hypothetical protein
MNKMKPKTLGYYKGVQNVPYCKAVEDMYVGMGVVLNRVAKTASLPGADAASCTHIVTNIGDKPDKGDYAKTLLVQKDEFVRADDLRSVIGLEMEFAQSEITDDIDQATTSLSPGDELVFGADGKLAAGVGAGNAVYFKIIEFTAYMDGGVLVEICEG